MEAQPERVAAAKPKRRWFQFRLATLLLLTLVCAVVLALWVTPAARQRRAVAFVESVGGFVEYADEGDQAALAPAWLREWLGPDYFQSVREVRLHVTQVSDAGLAHLKGLTALEVLYLDHTFVGDAGLAHLKGLTALETLDLDNTQVSDAGLAHLKGLTALERLYLDGTQISDAGLAHLKGLTALERLYLDGTQVSDAGIADLRAALPNCLIDH